MKVAIIGSRKLNLDISPYVPEGVTQLVSGGAIGIDSCVREYAAINKLPLVEFLPDYEKYGRIATLKRNNLIVEYADMVVAIWDGKSNGTRYTFSYAENLHKNVKVHTII